MQLSLISATGLLLLAPLASAADVPKQAPKEEPKLGSATSQGCFNSVRGLEKNDLELTKLSSGSCSAACRKLGKAVFATAPDGCYCGTEYPPKEDLSEDSACNNACPAYPLEACGGLKPKSYSVWNTGTQVDVSYLDLTVVERQDSPAINSGVSTAISSYYSSGYSSYPSYYSSYDSSGYSYPASYDSSGYSYPTSYDSSGYSYPTSYGSSGYSYPTSYGSSGYNYDSSVAASGVSTAAPTVTAAFASEAASSSSTGTATGSAASATTSTPSSGSRSMIGAGAAILAAALAI